MKRLSNITLITIAAVLVGLTIILSGCFSTETKGVTKPKYSLRSYPIKVSDKEIISKFELNIKDWRPLKYIQNDFTDNGNDTITDHATGLMWQKSGFDELPYKKAKAYIRELNRKKFAGYDDWRFPTVEELQSLITENKQSNDQYISPIFEKRKYNWFWSSDPHGAAAWVVDIGYGIGVLRGYFEFGHDVRAVRSLYQSNPPLSAVIPLNPDKPDSQEVAVEYPDEQIKSEDTIIDSRLPEIANKPYLLRSEPIIFSDKIKKVLFGFDKNGRPFEYLQNEFEDNRDGTITDHVTCLMWQKSGSPDTIDYEKANEYIKKLNVNKFVGYDDWRLPTVNELKSLITKEKQSNDSYISHLFDKKQFYCWTADQHPSGIAWGIYFGDGICGWSEIRDPAFVRAVRSIR